MQINKRKYLLIFTALVSMGAGLGGQNTLAQEADISQELAMTIYGDGRALVEDIRSFDFEKGRSVIVLPNVSSQIDAPSASFIAEGIEIVEQNFDFDLLTPNKLMQKAVGETVTIIRTNPGTGRETREKAKVLAVNNGVVVQIGDRIEVLRDDNLPTRVVFDEIPENLRAKPTLSVMVNSKQAGTRPATLTYLSGGLNWRADYVLNFNEDAEKMDFQGWATLTNKTNTAFKNVKTSLIAGNVGNTSNNNYGGYNQVRRGGNQTSPQERIGDSYLYSLPGTTTLASLQTKQIGFIDAVNVPAHKAYEYQANGFRTLPEPANVEVRIVFENSRAAGMGEALPKGIIRVYSKDQKGRSQFVGESNINHIAAGSEMSLKIGDAFDVTVQPTIISQNKVSKKRTDTKMRYTIKNAKKQAAKVTIRQNLWGWRTEYEVREENHISRRPDAYSRVWTVDVPSEGEAILNFTIRETRPY
jgi:hypothetical protein